MAIQFSSVADRFREVILAVGDAFLVAVVKRWPLAEVLMVYCINQHTNWTMTVEIVPN